MAKASDATSISAAPTTSVACRPARSGPGREQEGEEADADLVEPRRGAHHRGDAVGEEPDGPHGEEERDVAPAAGTPVVRGKPLAHQEGRRPAAAIRDAGHAEASRRDGRYAEKARRRDRT